MLAIIKVSGKQYKVRPDSTLDVERLEGKVGDALVLSHVLLVADAGKVTIGTPTVKGAAVKAKILSHLKAEKIHVRRYKSKVRYRKSRGFRSSLTKLAILSIKA